MRAAKAAFCRDVAGPLTRDAGGRETTPRFIVLDASGGVRHIASGWGSEMADWWSGRWQPIGIRH